MQEELLAVGLADSECKSECAQHCQLCSTQPPIGAAYGKVGVRMSHQSEDALHKVANCSVFAGTSRVSG